jgi:hypothetical protein
MSGMPGVQWRDPDLHEVIEFLSNPNSVIKVISRFTYGNYLSATEQCVLKPVFRIRIHRIGLVELCDNAVC